MDPLALESAMERGLTRLGHQGFLNRVVSPLAEQVGALWRSGDITAAHEHFFTASARTFLGSYTQQFAPAPDAPVLIVATPRGQHHELGAFMAAVAAIHLGWRTIHLGCSLPAAEIVAAVREAEARVLALSIIYPVDDPQLPKELQSIRKHLPDVEIIVGGRATDSYAGALKEIKARIVTDLGQLGDELDRIRAHSLSVTSAAGNRKKR
jgi:methanogenic corrinoid protein MtbC1